MCLLPQRTPDFSIERPLLLEFLGFFFPQLMWISLAFRNSFRPTHVETTNRKVFPLWQLGILKHFYLFDVCFSMCVVDECVLMFGGAGDRVSGSFFCCVFEAGSLTKPEADPLARPANWLVSYWNLICLSSPTASRRVTNAHHSFWLLHAFWVSELRSCCLSGRRLYRILNQLISSARCLYFKQNTFGIDSSSRYSLSHRHKLKPVSDHLWAKRWGCGCVFENSTDLSPLWRKHHTGVCDCISRLRRCPSRRQKAPNSLLDWQSPP